MSELDAFRTEVREWLEANCPPEMREPVRDEGDVCWGGRNWVFKNDAQKAWLEACVAKGYTVPDWPKAYGGAGLTPEQTKVFKQEMKRIHARSPRSEEHTSELQSLMRISYAVFCLKKKNTTTSTNKYTDNHK